MRVVKYKSQVPSLNLLDGLEVFDVLLLSGRDLVVVPYAKSEEA